MPRDGLPQTAPWLARITDWPRHLAEGASVHEESLLGDVTQTDYPLGDNHWAIDLETKSERRLRPGLPGRPRIVP